MTQNKLEEEVLAFDRNQRRKQGQGGETLAVG